MVRQLRITVPHEKAATIRDVLHGQKIVHHLDVYAGETSTMIICKVVTKKVDETLQLLARYSVGIGYGHIDVVALTSCKPRITTFRGSKKTKKGYLVTDRMSYDEMVDFIDSQIHLTFDYLALIAVGAVICAGGLLTNSAVNVVASMLVSPLMGPIVGMTFGTVIKNKRMFWISFRNEAIGLFVCWMCGVLMGFLVGTFYNAESADGPVGHNTEMSSRGTFKALGWGAGVALASGFGVALGVSSDTVAALIGVAISAALLPPIVNSGVCLGASFIMYFLPSQPDSVIVQHWIKTGILSLCLFLLNWIMLYFSALVMFRIKHLHHHANEERKKQNLAEFSKIVDTTFLSPTVNNLKQLQQSSGSIYPAGTTIGGNSSSNAFDTNMQSSSSMLRGGNHAISLQTPLLEEEDSVESAPALTSSRKFNIKKASSTKASSGKKHDFLEKKSAGNININTNTSESTTHFQQIFNLSNNALLPDGERLTQSAETAIIAVKASDMDLFTSMQLKKGSK